MNKFLIIATLCSFLLVAIVLCVGFSSFSDMSNGKTSQSSSVVVQYANKAISTVKSVVSPVLEKIGVEANSVDPREKVQRELENAGKAVDDAVKKISQ